MDYVTPTPIIGSLSSTAWGAANVGPRDQSNGLEDKTISNWSYWDGGILKDEQTGVYHMFASRWKQSDGHGGWQNDSHCVHATSNNLFGPYTDQGLCFPNDNGGMCHNVNALKLKAGDASGKQYAITCSGSVSGSGRAYGASSLDGSWTYIGNLQLDANGYSGQYSTGDNFREMLRPDGQYECINSRLGLADNILGPYKDQLPNNFTSTVAGSPVQNMEDPVLFYAGGVYHVMFHQWSSGKAYLYTSQDGVHGWTLDPGLAYDQSVDFVRYTDGTVNRWPIMERASVYVENGHAVALTFAVLDVQKSDDHGNDGNGSKIIVVPFDGRAYDCDHYNVGCDAVTDGGADGNAGRADGGDAGRDAAISGAGGGGGAGGSGGGGGGSGGRTGGGGAGTTGGGGLGGTAGTRGTAGAGGTTGTAGAGGTTGTGAAGTTGGTGRGGAAGTTGRAGTTGGAGSTRAGGAAGTTGAAGTSAAAGRGGAAGAGGPGESKASGCSCAVDGGPSPRWQILLFGVAAGLASACRRRSLRGDSSTRTAHNLRSPGTTQNRTVISAVVTTALALAAARSASAASLQQVSNWGVSGLPSDVSMYIYVPDRVATNPPVLTLVHYCGGTASAVFGQAQGGGIVSAADQYGFIMVVPSSGRCWDVESDKTWTRNGGGDSHAIKQMVTYAISKYSANADRVYSTGDSSGGMMTELLLAVYPDIFKAGAAFAGMPAGCRGTNEGGTSMGYSGACAGGNVMHTAQEWGDIARKMAPGYTGHRPRVQLFHGDADTTIRYANYTEAIKEWTNVLGLATNPTTTTANVSLGNHQATRQQWVNSCGYLVVDGFTSLGGDHGPSDALFKAQYVIPFLGLDKTGAVDPEIQQCGGGGAGGASGTDAGVDDGGRGGGGGAAAGGRGGSGTTGAGGVGGSAGSGGRGGGGGIGGRAGASGGGGSGGNGAAAGTGGSASTGASGGASGADGLGGRGGVTATAGSGGASGGAGTSGGGATGGSSPSGSGGASSGGAGGAEGGGWGCSLTTTSPRPGATCLLCLALAFAIGTRRRAHRLRKGSFVGKSEHEPPSRVAGRRRQQR